MTRTRQLISLAFVLCLLGLVVSQLRVNAESPETNENQAVSDEPKGLSFRLSEGDHQPEARPQETLAQSTPLSDAETESILKRLPPLATEADDVQDFLVRDQSLLPPRAGEIINVAFPSPVNISAPEISEPGPLRVLRYAPEGQVPIASQLSITFSQPMIPLSSQENVATYVPVKFSPQPPGKWRWIGVKTLLFEPDGKFPMATSYSVTIPAGTRSAAGKTLAEAKTWHFTTPSPTVKFTHPSDNEPQSRDSLMLVGFDQAIDSSAALRAIKVRAGSREIRTRLATESEINADDDLKKLALAYQNRFVAFRAVDSPNGPLPAATRIFVSIGVGVPSSEGPLATTKPEGYSFRTHGALRVKYHGCEDGKPCTPSRVFQIDFTNPIDEDTFDKSRVRIDPPLEGLETSIYGDALEIDGLKRPRTTYRITLDPSIKDKFGQTLGSTRPLSFHVGSAPRGLFATNKDLLVLDPFGPATFSVYSVNHRSLDVKLYSVQPDDYPKWVSYLSEIRNDTRMRRRRASQIRPLPGRVVHSKTIVVNSKPDEVVETTIDLTPALNDGYGQMILSVHPVGATQNESFVETWMQRTGIGLDAFVDNTELMGWATSLKDGSPLSGVEMRLLSTESVANSNNDGTARLSLPSASTSLGDLLIARRGRDVAILPSASSAWARSVSSWVRKPQTDSLRWYVFDDRKLYRPGEEVHIKGWIRRVGGSQKGDVGVAGDSATTTDIIYWLKDSRGNEITKAGARLGPLGGFDLKLKLPETINLGRTHLEFLTNSNLNGSGFSHSFEVQEFRRPEFEVTARNESDGPHIIGGHANVSVNATYFAGGGLQNTDVNWQVSSKPGSFTPPNRQDWTFGRWLPWWRSPSYDSRIYRQMRSERLTGRTDALGKHRLRIDFDSVTPPRPSSVTTEVTVMDVNRQQWTDTTTMLVHPASLYVGLRSEKTFVQQGEPLVVQSIVTDLDGNAVTGREIRMRAALLDWKQVKGEWEQVETNPRDCSIQSRADAAVCNFPTSQGGQYRVRATIIDDRERRNESELTLWVAGGQQPPRQETVEEEPVELIPDRKEYKSGDIADILIQSPFYPAEGLLTLRRSGIMKTERFLLSGPTHILRVPIEEAWTPNVHVHVEVVGAPVRDEPDGAKSKGALKRPSYATGELNLSIPPRQRKIEVIATPREKALEPGGETTVELEVRDHHGKSVSGGEVAVVVVDESVLALTDHKLQDPLAVFYAQRNADTSDFHLRKDLLLTPTAEEKEKFIEEFWRAGEGGGLGGGAGGLAMRRMMRFPPPVAMAVLRGREFDVVTKSGSQPALKPIRLRSNFDALALFAPSVFTDSNGRATVKVTLPDNLTRYRVMAVAVAGGKQFGIGESAITARLPVMVRASAPRFLNFGDRFDLPVVVQNQTDAPLTVDVVARATNAKMSAAEHDEGRVSSAGRRVSIPPNDRVEVRFPAAAMKAGTASFQIGAVSGNLSDASQVWLPVLTPATSEAFAFYGQIDNGVVAQPVKAPDDVFPQFGGLEITTSSTQLPELTEAVLYLTSYPYECSEQMASRVLGVVALQDVIQAFNSKALPPADALKNSVVSDLKRLEQLQHANGGFSFWRRDDNDWPYLGIHVAHAFARARNEGFSVRPDTWKKSLEYLRKIESHIPSQYSKDSRGALIAYAIYVRSLMDDKDTARARKLVVEHGLEKLSLESVGWLLRVLSGDKYSVLQVESIRRLLNNRVTETAGAAHFVTSYTDGAEVLLHSDRRVDGVMLEALIHDQPQSDLIPKIVKGLLAHRQRGRWSNTQENAFILIALDRYFNTYEKVTPDFVARVWLGDAYAGEQKFNGRSANGFNLKLPMRYLADQQREQRLTLSKDGAGRLYYRLALNYAPADLNLKSADHGFTVQRTYESVDYPEDVRQEADGTWHIKPGARVRIRVTMVAPTRRYHVALVDPLPAGFEALNPALATTGSIPKDEKQPGTGSARSNWWRWRTVWFDHQNLRDDRAEAFTSTLWEGVYTYSYVARATTPGVFIVPPPKAEEMYSPETFGRGKTDRVKVD